MKEGMKCKLVYALFSQLHQYYERSTRPVVSRSWFYIEAIHHSAICNIKGLEKPK